MDEMQDAGQLRELVRLLERKLGVLDDYKLACCDITMAQCHALVEIGREERISLNELAELLNLENSSMSRTVNNLVNFGLVKRDIDPQDRRFVTIALTESGEALFQSIEARMKAYFEKVLAQLPENKREQILESLHLLLGAIGKEECC